MNEESMPNPRGFGTCLVKTMKMTEEFIARGLPLVVEFCNEMN
jgi:hypothetical protein